MILNTHYAYGAGVSGAVIVVTAPTGSTVTASLDGVVYTAQEVNGTWTFKVRKFGTYTVTATLGSQTASTTVEVTEKKTYEVALAYTFQVRITGDGSAATPTTSDAYVEIGGTQYKHPAAVEVQPNTSITVSAYVDMSMNNDGVFLNGVRVSPSRTNVRGYYNLTVDKDVTVQLSYTAGAHGAKASRANIVY